MKQDQRFAAAAGKLNVAAVRAAETVWTRTFVGYNPDDPKDEHFVENYAAACEAAARAYAAAGANARAYQRANVAAGKIGNTFIAKCRRLTPPAIPVGTPGRDASGEPLPF